MKIAVFGTGYVGLVTGTCFSEMGNDVICVDIDSEKISALQNGHCPIYEPGLETLIQTNTKAGRLQFTTDAKKACLESNLLFIAVGTPPHEDGSADLKHVLSVAKSIGEFISDYKIIINKSTVPVGTGVQVREAIDLELKKRNLNLDFDVVSNPEFLKEGAAIEDCLKPSRVVIGCDSPRPKEILTQLYEPFLRHHHGLFFMDLSSAEMTKYAANAMLATKISFMNELSRICEQTGADIEAVRVGIGSDPRIGYDFIYPGLGYGGSCFPKDVQALIQIANSHQEPAWILNAVEKTNKRQRHSFFSKIESHYATHPERKKRSLKFALWGLSFKPGTDDIREAPSFDLIESLKHFDCQVVAYDPVSIPNAKKAWSFFSHLSYADTMYDALKGADALIIATEWKPFREPDFQRMKSLLKEAVIFDGRNLYDPLWVEREGFFYECVGRPQKKARPIETPKKHIPTPSKLLTPM